MRGEAPPPLKASGMVQFNRRHLADLCRANGITKLRIFGPAARGDDRPDSDVDLIAELTEILDAIDGALAEQRPVYVHCWGRAGRTGVVVGCHLVRCGSTEAALEQVANWWRTVEKHGHSPHSPQTSAQRKWVRTWSER